MSRRLGTSVILTGQSFLLQELTVPLDHLNITFYGLFISCCLSDLGPFIYSTVWFEKDYFDRTWFRNRLWWLIWGGHWLTFSSEKQWDFGSRSLSKAMLTAQSKKSDFPLGIDFKQSLSKHGGDPFNLTPILNQHRLNCYNLFISWNLCRFWTQWISCLIKANNWQWILVICILWRVSKKSAKFSESFWQWDLASHGLVLFVMQKHWKQTELDGRSFFRRAL